MKRIAAMILLIMSFLPAAFAAEQKSIKDQLGLSTASLKAPEAVEDKSAKKDPRDWNGSASSGTPGFSGPVVPVNGVCPAGYDCISRNEGASLSCRRGGDAVQPVGNCANVTRYCANLKKDIAEQKSPTPLGQTPSSEEREYARLCV